ncbi:MAG: GNAT family N-acetyltransferase [Achromobacter sp.]|uniref:GNAT family N-acetyltransferase n=1 Tax=unclassified Achromobacter TaxID=2626865 RepID=UPI0006F2023B|nr:GNAT family N-acetyltransferase [Achromobacter sp. Root565]KRA00857.1 GNAT family acetyltransferase [Achromobacter sp. Root565]
MRILVNIDVPDLEHAIGFYQSAFGLTLNRRLGSTGAELLGADAPIYLLEKASGTPAAGAVRQPRDYARHWTPVHLDVVVDDVDQAVARAVAAGARLEDPPATHDWGRIAHLADPYGHGICILQFLGRGYDELAPGTARGAAAETASDIAKEAASDASKDAAPLRFTPAAESDFEALLALRIAAMRDSLERLGRFDPDRARERLRGTFRPECTWHIEADGERVGFYCLRPDGDGLRLDHLYVHPSAQGRGLGGQVLRRILRDADRRRAKVTLSALRGSDSNRFYRRHGFVPTGEGEWDIDYVRDYVPVDLHDDPRPAQAG